MEWRAPDESLTGTAAKRFNTTFLSAARQGGMDPCPGPQLETWLRDAGFRDVRAESFVLPVGIWPADKHLVSEVPMSGMSGRLLTWRFFLCLQKEVGAWNYLQCMEGLEAFSYGIFTRILGYSKREVDVVCAKIRKDLKNPKIHPFFSL